jgi:hypothetical protein
MTQAVASDQAQEIRESVKEKWGFVPNLVEQLVVSPETARLYLEGSEIVAGGVLIVSLVGLKTISNYVNHIAHTEVDPQFGS